MPPLEFVASVLDRLQGAFGLRLFDAWFFLGCAASVLALALWARWRRRAGVDAAAVWGECLFGASVLFLLVMTLRPGHVTAWDGGRAVELVPFGGWRTGARQDQMVANTLLTVPIGLLAVLGVPALRRWSRILLLAFGLPAAVEAAQFLVVHGRVASVEDVLLNALGVLGGALVALAGRRSWSRRDRVPATSTVGNWTDLRQ